MLYPRKSGVQASKIIHENITGRLSQQFEKVIQKACKIIKKSIKIDEKSIQNEVWDPSGSAPDAESTWINFESNNLTPAPSPRRRSGPHFRGQKSIKNL